MSAEIELLNSTRQTPDFNVEKNDKTIEIHTAEGNYTIIYGLHSLGGEYPNLLPASMGGIVMEGMLESDRWEKDMPNYAEALKKQGAAALLFPELEKRRIPIFSADIGLTKTAHIGLLTSDAVITAAEGVLAITLAKQTLRKSELSRRQFLKNSTAIGAAAYLSLSPVSFIFRTVGMLTSIGDDASAELTKLSIQLHPENSLLQIQIRSAIIAAKEKIILINKLVEDPSLTTTIGGFHVDIEDRIQDSLEDNLNFIRSVKPLLEVYDHESLYTSHRYDYTHGVGWKQTQVYTFPQIQEAIS